eukprot:TRINITY_DN2198_c0_g6_i1.p1 TRINITY_DN2198_c0_g6~~TRINITY_DN2198_c0_g6_i1.p1  ORF type:complete len:135 (-),score=22.99 TRINITY_DN2198_c0_g6_i1:197-601(-)
MLRQITRSLGQRTSQLNYRVTPLSTLIFRPSFRSTSLSLSFTPLRFYSDAHKLSYAEVESRVLKVVKAFDKVDPNIVTVNSTFQKDLGVDSLDAVELVMALEDEFVIQIPDEEAEKITSCLEAINYISTHPHAK